MSTYFKEVSESQSAMTGTFAYDASVKACANIRHMQKTRRLDLVINKGISNNQKAWLFEGLLDLIGKCTRCEAAGNGDSTGVLAIFQDWTLTIGSGRHNSDVGGVFNRGNDTSSKLDFFKGSAKVKQEDAWESDLRECNETQNHVPSGLRFQTYGSI